MITRKDEHKIDNANSLLGGSGNVQFSASSKSPRSFITRGVCSR